MKKVNTVLLNARMREKEDVVQLGVQMARHQAEGVTIENAMEDASEALELSEDAILLLESEAAMKGIYKDTQNFIAFNNAIETARGSGLLTEEELEPMQKVVAELEAKISTRFDIDIEELYEEEE